MTEAVPKLNLMCLLPVRNAEKQLPRYFESIRTFCRGVIALDDGSTDGTADILSNEPLVKLLLTNPRRPSYLGWNDSLNRQRLLDACVAFSPSWVFWLDADEIVPACDALRLVSFILSEAKTDEAYAFEVLRMIGTSQHYDMNKLWVFRLFAYKEGYILPTDRLHFEPVPNQIGRECWKRLRLRIAHLAGLTASRRRARYQKYVEADPNCEWQDSYDGLLTSQGHLRKVLPLKDGISVLIDQS